MRSESSSTPVRLLTILVVAIGLAGCGTSAADTGERAGEEDSRIEGASSPDVQQKGFVEAVEAAFGHELGDIDLAFEHAAAEKLAECMVERGWDYTFTAPQRLDPMSIERLTAAEQGLLDLEQVELSRSPEHEETPPEYNLDEAECWEKAAESTPNPVATALNWLNNEASDLYLRVSADDRVVDAKAEEIRCISEAGYDPDELADVGNGFVARANAIVEAVQAGTLNMGDAKVELEDLAIDERVFREAVDPCIDARLAIERQVALNVEEEWLRHHGDRLSAFLHDLQDEVADLSTQLNAIASDG